MKDYIKPTFTLAGLVPIALAGSSGCPVTTTDLSAIVGKWGITDVNTALGIGEDCVNQIAVYCKFTSTDDPEFKVIGS